jgi:hypothetical protein
MNRADLIGSKALSTDHALAPCSVTGARASIDRRLTSTRGRGNADLARREAFVGGCSVPSFWAGRAAGSGYPAERLIQPSPPSGMKSVRVATMPYSQIMMRSMSIL